MAITSAICTSFKVEVLKGVHNFTATSGNTFKIALYDSDATLTSVTPVASSTTAVCDFSDVSYSSASFTANGALIYNSSASNVAVCAIAFGSNKTATNGTFTIQFPTADATNAIIRLA